MGEGEGILGGAGDGDEVVIPLVTEEGAHCCRTESSGRSDQHLLRLRLSCELRHRSRDARFE